MGGKKAEKLYLISQKISQAPHARCRSHPKGTALHCNTFEGRGLKSSKKAQKTKQNKNSTILLLKKVF